MKNKILLADDHSMIRKGIKILFELNFGYSGIGEVRTCSELMRELSREEYTHLVLDINLTDGSTLEILPNIRALYPSLQIVIFSMQPSAVYGRALRQLGISRFISKSAPEEETIMQLRKFLQNEQPLQAVTDFEDPTPFSELTHRELEVLHYLLKGMGTNDIANTLNLKWNTISTVKNRIFEKTNTSNAMELKELAGLFRIS